MTVLTDNTKVSRVNKAFGQITKEYMETGNPKVAKTILDAFSTLNPDSKVKLFDILTKVC